MKKALIAILLLVACAFAQPAQPNQPQYAVSQLNLFPVYASRAAYQQATGHQAPPFSANLPLKYWEDTSAKGDASYAAFDATANPPIKTITVPAASLKVNLPGTYAYPAFVEAPTTAIQTSPTGAFLGGVSPQQLCIQADAKALAESLKPLFPGETYVIAEYPNPQFPYVYGNEQRRAWYIKFSKHTDAMLAESLIEQQNVNGVGAPGQWKLVPRVQVGGTNAGKALPPTLKWASEPKATTPADDADVIPVPIRLLMANEQFVFHQSPNPLAPSQWLVARTDLAQPAKPQTTDEAIAELKALIQQLLSRPCGTPTAQWMPDTRVNHGPSFPPDPWKDKALTAPVGVEVYELDGCGADAACRMLKSVKLTGSVTGSTPGSVTWTH